MRRRGRIIMTLEAAVSSRIRLGANKERPLALSSQANPNITRIMTKTLEVISEAIRNPKHPFRKVENQPKKPMKNRYERRKIKEYLHLGNWVAEEAT
jgi:hypothetical protein